MNEAAVQPLFLVSDELSRTLDEARRSLEAYVQDGGGRGSLHRCIELIHLVRGALKIVEVHGAALLAEEMEQTLKHLAETQNEQIIKDGVDALSRAMVQLPAYLDRLQSGGKDIALVLLPLLNDLRAARGKPLLSEGTLLLLNVTPAGGGGPAAPRADSGESAQDVARRLRPAFQLALLGWIREENTDHNLAKMLATCRELSAASQLDIGYQLWQVVAGVVEGLSIAGLESTVALKRLVGQVDRQLKRIIDGGEEVLGNSPPTDLMNNLLFYVARSKKAGPVITDVREKFGLDDLMPDEAEVAEAREGLSGPSVKLMQTVAAAIKEDLASVKDVLDIFVRTGMQSVEELKPQLEMLKKISDTLGVLGLAGLRDQIQGQVATLNGILTANHVADERVLIDMAATLLATEDSLDQQLVRAIAPAADAAEERESEEQAEYRHVTQAVVRECVVNLARIKEAIAALLRDPDDSQLLDQVQPELQGIKAGLLMLERPRAVSVVEGIGDVIAKQLAHSAEPLKGAKADRLADAVVSLEYYFETLAAGRAEPEYMLDNAERCLKVLDAGGLRPVPTETSKPVAPKPKVAVIPKAPPPVMAASDDRSDPELVELFIEEAKEELAKIESQLPLWLDNAGDSEALINARRSFHTLKGSGRMVGAHLLGEFAWSVENLLNRLINKTLDFNEPMGTFLRTSIDALPQLIDQLELGTSPKADVPLLMKQADAFAEGDPDAASITSASLRLPALDDAEVAESAEETGRMDPVLKEIFIKEAREHLATIESFLEQRAGISSQASVSDALYRACHTLAGSANMAGVEQAMAIAAPLNEHIRRRYDEAGMLTAEDLALVTDASAALTDQVERLANDDELRPPDLELVQRLEDAGIAGGIDSAADDSGRGEPAAEPAPAEAVDPEIAAIFAEEASELLEQADVANRQLVSSGDSQDDQHLIELQRLLHTLKGGARMAGLTPMGNLSHALESLLARMVESGRRSERTFAVLRACLDELHTMQERASQGEPLSDPAALIDETNAALEPTIIERVPQPEELPAADQTSVLPPIEVGGYVESLETQPEEREDGEATGVLSEEQEGAAFEAAAEAAATAMAGEFEEAFAEAGSDDEQPEADAQEQAPVEMEQPLAQEPPAESLAEAEPVEATEEEPAAPVAAPARQTERQEVARVDALLLDAMLNNAGEITIFQSRLNQQVRSVEFNLQELSQTVIRLREQLRKLELETEAQILYRHQEESEGRPDFDPLEMDRYSTIQQLSRALAESVSDVGSINDLLRSLVTDADTLLTQQSRVTTELQDGLMRTRMVPFERHVSRLERIVRQAAAESGKEAALTVTGSAGEMDRQVLERMLPPFEHLLRNAVAHGIEAPDEREANGKPRQGAVELMLSRDGSEVHVEIADDGAGLDLDAIRRKAREQGLLDPGADVTDQQAVELILRPGFTTAGELTQTAGRGVGMDVVDNEVKLLGGSLRVETQAGKGTRFIIRLPYTLAITQALIVSVGEETFALPLPTVEGLTRVPKDHLLELLTQDDPRLVHGDISYRVQHLGLYLGAGPSALPEDDTSVPLVLVRAGENSTALLADDLEGSREIVVKTLGPQVTAIPGVSGATILGDGRIVVILDAVSLVRSQRDQYSATEIEETETQREPTALVVDDSITVRRVTQRLLERHGMRVVTAKDGLDAISQLQDLDPDIILLDIEMPRMDGYQFASHVRNDPRVKDVPIIMITSRAGEKHRARAIEIGVNDYLSKPYQERQLINAIEPLLGQPL